MYVILKILLGKKFSRFLHYRDIRSNQFWPDGWRSPYKLELSRVHTPRTPSYIFYLQSLLHRNRPVMLMISTRPVMHMSRKHMAWNVLVQVGTVDGRGYDVQQEDAICNVRGPWQTIQSAFKPICCWFWLIDYACKLLRCLDLEIWRFSWWQQMDR